MDDLTATIESAQYPTEEVAHKIEQVLHQRGIDIPYGPDSSSSEPRPWLLRGESSANKLYSANKLEPQPGEMGTWGVFFADCLSALYKYEKGGVYYVIPTNKLTESWLTTPSTEYQTLLDHIATKYNLNPSSIGDGVEVEQKIFKEHNVYQAKRGIVTSHVPVPVEWASAILVDTGGKNGFDIDTLPPTIREKIVEF